MSKKYLNKQTIIYKFRDDILLKDDNEKLGDEGREMLWQLYLYQMSLAKFITARNAKTWVYPNKILK